MGVTLSPVDHSLRPPLFPPSLVLCARYDTVSRTLQSEILSHIIPLDIGSRERTIPRHVRPAASVHCLSLLVDTCLSTWAGWEGRGIANHGPLGKLISPDVNYLAPGFDKYAEGCDRVEHQCCIAIFAIESCVCIYILRSRQL